MPLVSNLDKKMAFIIISIIFNIFQLQMILIIHCELNRNSTDYTLIIFLSMFLFKSIRRFNNICMFNKSFLLQLNYSNFKQTQMIWDIIQTSSFNDHFKKEILNIQDLLADQNIITEMTNLNPQLLAYIDKNREQVFSKMIHYATVLPDQDSDHNRGYLYPYVSSQILAIDSDIIYNCFFAFDDKSLNAKSVPTSHWFTLIDILNNPQTLANTVILGYFVKIMNNLYKGRKLEFTRVILQQQYIRKKLSQHLLYESIGQIIRNIFILLDTPQQMLIEQRKTYLLQIVDILVQPNSCADALKQQTIRKVISTEVLSPVITKFQTYSSGQQLIQALFDYQGFQKLYQIHSSLGIIQLFTNILNKTKQTISTADDYKKQYMLELSAKHKQNFINFGQQHLQLLIAKHVEHNTVHMIQNQNRIKVKPTNPQILLYCCFLVEISQNCLRFERIAALKAIEYLFSVMINHPFNDILQSKIVKICVFLSKIKEEISQSERQLIQLFLIKFLEICKTQSNNYRPHLYTIWRLIRNQNKTKQLIKQIIQAGKVPMTNIIKWQELSQQFFGVLLKAQSMKWGTDIKAHFGGKIIVDQQDKQQNKSLNTQAQSENKKDLSLAYKKQQAVKQSNLPFKSGQNQLSKQIQQLPVSNLQKQLKLIQQSSNVTANINIKNLPKDPFSFDFFGQISQFPKKESVNNSLKKPEKKQSSIIQQSKKGENSKKVSFDDFANFGF